MTTVFPALRQFQTPQNFSGKVATALMKPALGDLATTMSSCDDPDEYDLMPSFLHSLYGTAAHVPATKDKNVLGVAGYQRDYLNSFDLVMFMGEHRALTRITRSMCLIPSMVENTTQANPPLKEA
ncbi:hypothetical protein EI94DRAFT_1724459 [Lactarius quietus]|nr:hypothetical protein EI94DRAFT_1724459 [Lactarius quietus]